MKSRIYAILEVAFIAIFIFSSYRLFLIFSNYYEGNEIYSESQELYFEEPENPDDGFKVDFKSLKQVNNEALGWIYIEDTPINYPLLQTDNNDYYLKHTYDRRYSDFGSIFIDYRSSSDLTDPNTIIYGHNTKNGSMFGTLKKYKDKSYLEQHPCFYIIYEDATYKYEIISAFTAQISNPVYNLDFADENKFTDWITQVCKSSEVDAGNYVPTGEEKIVTLSTCTSRTRTERFVIVGVQVDVSSNKIGGNHA